MEEFLKMLDGLKGQEDLIIQDLEPYETETYTRYYNSQLKEVSDIESTACKLLIDSDGHCNWDNINTVKQNGFHVFKGDGDSFGWLVGCIVIETVKGIRHILSYG